MSGCRGDPQRAGTAAITFTCAAWRRLRSKVGALRRSDNLVPPARSWPDDARPQRVRPRQGPPARSLSGAQRRLGRDRDLLASRRVATLGFFGVGLQPVPSIYQRRLRAIVSV
jgi:hypothetical protein